MEILMILALSLLSGCAYRMGGIGGKWYLNTKIRDLGCPLCAIGVLLVLKLGTVGPWAFMSLIPTFILMYGSLTTYWKRKGDTDVQWYSWTLTGFFYGLSLILFAMASGLWLGFLIRLVALTLLIPIWSEYHDNVWWEEIGRGVLFTGTMVLLLC